MALVLSILKDYTAEQCFIGKKTAAGNATCMSNISAEAACTPLAQHTLPVSMGRETACEHRCLMTPVVTDRGHG